MPLDVLQIIDLTEGLDFEAKKAAGRDGQGHLPDSFFSTYSAMANTEGGVVLLGLEQVTDGSFQVSGIVNPNKVVRELWGGLNNKEKTSCNILTDSDVQILEMEGKKVVQVTIPRAVRSQLPVYLGKNPLAGTYRRCGEGDFRCDEETVKRMLADQVEDARDAKLLENFNFSDLNLPTFRAYRTTFKTVKPEHPWLELENEEFLRSIGGWTMNRETKREGLTLAGLPMFGKLRSILDAVPHYVVDYQERPADAVQDTDRRWIDRVTTDGTWSGNLYDFYRMVILHLTHDLKIPFKLKGTTRVDDTPVHETMREALTNLVIHADFTGRVSLYVVKRQDMFGFRNPGLMRVPLQLAIRGGNSDCRNRNLQKMFQLVGLAEQAGSGLPKVYRNWRQHHWRMPELIEQIDPDQTILRLRTVSLLPDATMAELDKRFGHRFRELSDTARMALATVTVEGSVTHARLREMCSDHPKDLSKTLAELVAEKFLVSRGATRATVYFFPDKAPEPSSDGLVVLGYTQTTASTTTSIVQHTNASSTHSVGGLEHLAERLEHSPGSLEHLAQLRPFAEAVSNAKKSPKATVQRTIIELCSKANLTAQQLADLLDRDVYSLKNHYLKPMVKSGSLKLRFPEKPNHPQQAYLADASPSPGAQT